MYKVYRLIGQQYKNYNIINICLSNRLIRFFTFKYKLFIFILLTYALIVINIMLKNVNIMLKWF